jgi:hypothetical protein
VAMAGALQFWKSRAPAKCWFFLWLALRDRCWATDGLERCGLPCPRRAPAVIKPTRSPSPTYCLVVCCHGRCGPPTYIGGTGRIGCCRKRPWSWIGCNPRMGGVLTCAITGWTLSLCAGAFGGTRMTSSLKVLPPPLWRSYARSALRTNCGVSPVSLEPDLL